VVRGGRDGDLRKRASLLRRDSIHGPFNGHITVDEDNSAIIANGNFINAITPVLKVINDKFGVNNGHVETVHSYTNDQNLIDNYHSAERRGRSAPLNMVLTSTGAAKAVSKALPELEGKLTGNAIRVPTPNVSMAVCNLNLSKPTTRDELNEYVREMAFNSSLQQQISYSYSTEVVSTDFVGTPEPAIFDSVATIVEGDRCVLYVWYDNEYGYSTQVLRCMQQMVGLHIMNVPE